MTSLISVENINKTYGSYQAVSNLSFDLYNGEIFALLGPNGAGKSTTIRMILDIIRPDSGEIRITGKKINDELRDLIGYLPEERGLYKDSKIIDVMVYIGQLKGLARDVATKRSMELLERLELADKAKQKVKEFSKGMQQKVQFAVTILHQPKILVIDEPFSGLDPVNTRIIEEMLMEQKAQGVGIIMSTHQMHQVEQMADRLMMVNRGKRVLYGDVTSVRREFAQHAVVVEGQGDWAILPGVQQVSKDANSRDGQLLYLEAGVSPDDILGEIARSAVHRIDRFELALPSLNDIFISSVGETIEDIEREHEKQKSGALNG